MQRRIVFFIFTLFLSAKSYALTVHEIRKSIMESSAKKVPDVSIDIIKEGDSSKVQFYKKSKRGMGMGVIPLQGNFNSENDLYWVLTNPKNFIKHKPRLIEIRAQNVTTKESQNKRRFSQVVDLYSSSTVVRFQMHMWDGTIQNEAYFINIPDFEKLKRKLAKRNRNYTTGKYTQKYTVEFTKVLSPQKLVTKEDVNLKIIESRTRIKLNYILSGKRKSRSQLKASVVVDGEISSKVKKIYILSPGNDRPIRKKIKLKESGAFGLKVLMIWSHAELSLESINKKCLKLTPKQRRQTKIDCSKQTTTYVFSHRVWNDGIGSDIGGGVAEAKQGPPHIAAKVSFGSSILSAKDTDYGFTAELPSKSYTRFDLDWKTLFGGEKFQFITNINMEQIDRVQPEGYESKNMTNSLIGVEFKLRKRVLEKFTAEIFLGGKQLESTEEVITSDKINNVFLSTQMLPYSGGSMAFHWLEKKNWSVDLESSMSFILPLNSFSGSFQYVGVKYVRGKNTENRWGINLAGIRQEHSTPTSQSTVLGFNMGLNYILTY